ncbi:transcriptional regulator (plasmid) [Azospirillum sp. B510]|uniref:LysR family transcriptional regulator n=1 Tax=Azospirillum sp. (strain B510) TaxID=137722 RepID=UPI0001C4CC8E|nr:LysR family transcriptional regulator [Azospirillum sp. B510]BAI74900.1 transcriptional regulator [Azospirillum sp. B510]
MPIRRLDLNLLRVFEAVMLHRSVTGASRELRVTPSAVSHALARLRQALDDDLFIPGDSGMEPTARALQLSPGIADGLGRIADAMSRKAFIPSEAVRTFRIAATDYAAVVVLPRIVARISPLAPQIDLRVFPLNRMDVVRQLDDGRVDFVIGWFADLPDRMCHATLLQESEAMVVRRGHPLTTGPVTRERLFDFPHVVVELTGSEDVATDGFIDDRGVSRRVWIERLILEAADGDTGLTGRVAISVPHYAAVPPLLQVSDMVATLPGRLAARAVEQSGLVTLDLPYQPQRANVDMIWHRRAERDAGASWMIQQITAAMADPAS